MLFGFNDKIWFYREPVDFRKQANGLMLIVADHLQLDPTSGQIFVFRNKAANKIKLLWWDRNGFWLFYKTLERQKFCFPGTGDTTWELSKDQLGWLLSGLDITKHEQLCEVKASNFY